MHFQKYVNNGLQMVLYYTTIIPCNDYVAYWAANGSILSHVIIYYSPTGLQMDL